MKQHLWLAGSLLLSSCATTVDLKDDSGNWLSWRGPQQNGTSLELGLPEHLSLDADGLAWTLTLRGRGTPVVAGGRLFAIGYEGEGPELQEVMVCLDVETGKELWQHRFNDFLSDVIYDRYGIASPVVDADTGHVYVLTAGGLFNAFSRDGELLWQRSMQSEYGRLTFPNGRVGAAVIDEERVIIHIISSCWGPQGPARDRFFAFDKLTGECIWVCTPGTGPKDSSFSYPVLTWQNGRRVLIAGTGCGHVVCIDARTGDAIWRYQASIGGVNSSVLLYGDDLIAIHGKENLDTSTIGRFFSLRLGAEPEPGAAGPVVIGKDWENWRNNGLAAFTSSPVLVGNRVYQTIATGDLLCLNADSGEVLWHEKLAPDQIHASPLAADGKLYVPMTNGTFHIIRPTDAGPEILQQLQLEGNCLGAPAIAGGRIFVHTTEKLYCFKGSTSGQAEAPKMMDGRHPDGLATRLQMIPGDIVIQPGDKVSFRVHKLDERGNTVGSVDAAEWDAGRIAATFDGNTLQLADDARPGVAVIKTKADGVMGTVRIRIVEHLPIKKTFEDVALGEHPKEPGVMFAYPPGEWIGTRFKWEVRELDGNKVLAKTLDNNLFQRTMGFFGRPEMTNYTMQANIMTDGNRRTKSSAGLVNQRYLVQLKGNYQELEVSSNHERFKHAVPFQISANTWYTLKTRIDMADDGSGIVRAKAWKTGEPEPAEWTLEVHHENAHKEGSPGLFGFAPQSRFRVYVDDIMVTPNE